MKNNNFDQLDSKSFDEIYHPVKEHDGCAGCGRRVLVTGLVCAIAFGIFKLCTHAPFVAAIKVIPISTLALGVGLGIVLTIVALVILACYCLKDCRVR